MAVARFLLEFWRGPDGCLRPLTNANVLLDFSRYKAAPYFDFCVKYLAKYATTVNYARQISEVHSYLCRTRILHRYADFSLVGAVSSAPNTKQLQRIGHANDDAVSQLARAHFYKYRATSLAFGFHAQIVLRLRDFAGFHSLRKNCLLDHYAGPTTDSVEHPRSAVAPARSTQRLLLLRPVRERPEGVAGRAPLFICCGSVSST